MLAMKKTVIVVVVVFLTFLLIGYLLPSQYKIERSVIVNAPEKSIFPHIADLKKWQNWGVWFKRDLNITIEYVGEKGVVGMKSIWVGEVMGEGEIEIIALESNHRLIYTVRLADASKTSTGEFVLTKVESGTQVVWMEYGNVGYNPIHRYVAFFMDYSIGHDFELGLDNLKLVAESS